MVSNFIYAIKKTFRKISLIRKSYISFEDIDYRDIEENTTYSQHNNGIFVLKNGKKEIGEFKLIQLPGCCGVCVLFNVEVRYSEQNKGIGKILFKKAVEIAREMKYTTLICTTVDDCVSTKIVKKQEWTKIYDFINKKTENKVNLNIIDL